MERKTCRCADKCERQVGVVCREKEEARKEMQKRIKASKTGKITVKDGKSSNP